MTKVLFEKQRSEGVQVESPVGPDVAASAYIICVLQAVLCEGFIESVRAVEEEVGVSAGKPVELVAGLLDALKLGVKLRRLCRSHRKRTDVIELVRIQT